MTRATFAPRHGLSLVFGAALALHVVDSIVDGLQTDRPWWRLLLAIAATYFLCICIHDAVHGVLHRHRGVNQVMGFVLGLVVGLPFALLQRAHLLHHQRVGHDDDPEAVVYRCSLMALPLRLPLIPLLYLRTLTRLRVSQLLLTALHVALIVIVVGVAEHHGVPVVSTWAPPTLIAVMWFGFTTVWVPHGPDAARFMRFFNAHSGWHDDHHADPRYGFPQYAQLRAHRLVVGDATPVSAGELRRTQRLGGPLWPVSAS